MNQTKRLKPLAAAMLSMVIAPIAVSAPHDHDHGDERDHGHAEEQGYKEHGHDSHRPEHYPGLTAHLDFVQHLDSVHHATDDEDEITEAYAHGHLDLGLHFNPSWRLNTSLKLEGHAKGEAGHGHGEEDEGTGDRWWEEHELMFETLNVEYESEHFGVTAGKFNPVFGLNKHYAPGSYGYLVFESYEITGRVGVALWGGVDGGHIGRHRLDVSAFHLDTSAFSQTWITENDQVKRSDGGVSNTGNLSSWTVALSGEGFLHDGLSYGIGAAEQAKGVNNEDDESRWWFALRQQFDVGSWSGHALVEVMDIEHLGGEAAHDRQYITAGLALERGKWRFGGSVTSIDNSAGEEDENHDGHIFQASVGYEVRRGVTLALGFKDSEQDNEERDRIGISVKVDTDLIGH